LDLFLVVLLLPGSSFCFVGTPPPMMFSLLTLRSLARATLEAREPSLPLEMDWPLTLSASMRLLAAPAIPPPLPAPPVVRALYTSETYSMKEVRWLLPRWVRR
jgi:hypothetical protein